MMTHNKCKGVVLPDLMYKSETFIDVYCLMCGQRWHVPKSNPFAKYVMQNG